MIISFGACFETDEQRAGNDPDPEEPIEISGRITESDLQYLGAFRLPEELNWGAYGCCFYAAGDGGRGSLLVTGNATRPAEFAEVLLPVAEINGNWELLPLATLLSQLRSFDGDLVERDLGEASQHTISSGIEVVEKRGSQSGPKLYGSVDCWYWVTEGTYPTIFMSELDGSNPRGMFHVGPREFPFHGNRSGDFLFRVPGWFADRYLGGRILVTGKTRGAFGGSMGPTLFAFKPWETETPSGDLDAVALLWYRLDYGCASPNVSDKSRCDFPEFTMCDKWEGGAFIESDTRAAIVLFGRKGLGVNGYGEPPGGACSMYKGYHCDPFVRQAIFYDALELAEVAAGSRDPWSVRPYRSWRPAEFYNSDGSGHSCGELGGVAYDPAGKRLYVIEKSLPAYNADDLAVVHVWQVK
jgi:hypothetical protein